MIRYILNDDGVTTREEIVNEVPAWQKHLDSAGHLTVAGYLTLYQDMRLDELERRELL